MPTAEIALTADLVRSQGAFLPAALSFEDFQFSVLRLLIIRVRRTQVVSFAAACSAGHPRNDDLARRGIEGPFVNSPNAWLRLRCVSSVRGRLASPRLAGRSLWYCWIRLKYFTLGDIFRAYVLWQCSPVSLPSFLPSYPRTVVNVLTRCALVARDSACRDSASALRLISIRNYISIWWNYRGSFGARVFSRIILLCYCSI